MAALGILACASPTIAGAATFVVTKAADHGPGSLRSAIESANHHAGHDAIHFALRGSRLIRPVDRLPAVLHAVTIDATTQPGFSGTPLVRLDGAGAGAHATGLDISAGSTTVRGLAVTGWRGEGIKLTRHGANRISGNYIGTDGRVARGNGVGVLIAEGAARNAIGGPGAAQGNVISGNRAHGLYILGTAAHHNRIQGNYIGTSADGARPLGNVLNGIYVCGGCDGHAGAPHHNVIGGTAPGAGNLISGNHRNGVFICGCGQFRGLANNNVLEGNRIGTNAEGRRAVGNRLNGVFICGCSKYGGGARRNRVGGAAREARNVISGNVGNGVYICSCSRSGGFAIGNVVEGNFLGTNVDGSAALGNRHNGLYVCACTRAGGGMRYNRVGGIGPYAGNLISGNTGNGIFVCACSRSTAFVTATRIAGNQIGTGADGRRAMGNGLNGIYMCACTKYSGGVRRNTIGGGSAGSRNVISGNAGNGIFLCACSSSGGFASSNLVQGNNIGVAADGSAALGNKRDGISICDCGGGAHHNLVGSKSRSAGNVISHNGGNGVLMTSVNAVVGNSIFSNTSLGIGVAGGSTGVQAAPTLTSVAGGGGSTTISGRAPKGTQRIEVFANTSCADPEGRTLIGVATTSSGSWSVTAGGLVAGQGVTATATQSRASKTSGFSACRPV